MARSLLFVVESSVTDRVFHVETVGCTLIDGGGWPRQQQQKKKKRQKKEEEEQQISPTPAPLGVPARGFFATGGGSGITRGADCCG